MITERLNAHNIKDIERAAELINAGGIVAFPTETVYGLGALGLSSSCIEKIFTAKNRPSNNPLIEHVSSFEQACALWDCDSDVITKRAYDLCNIFWPGPLTIINYKSKKVPDLATGGLSKVAVRFPAHPIAQQLLALCNEPLVAPSANISNRPSPTCADHVLRTLDGKIDAVLDGGNCSYGIESTVIDITYNQPVILRPGALSLDEIKKTLSDTIIHHPTHLITDQEDDGIQLASPGCFKKHYAPLITHRFIGDQRDIVNAWLNSEIALLIRETTFKSHYSQIGPRPQNSYTAIMPDEAQAYSSSLYNELYRLEDSGKDNALIESIPNNHSAWNAVNDRITRAVA